MYSNGQRIWFVNKRTGKPESAIVLSSTDDFFYFFYQGRAMKCSYVYAKGKVFISPQSVLEFMSSTDKLEVISTPRKWKNAPSKPTSKRTTKRVHKTTTKTVINPTLPVKSPYVEPERNVCVSPACDNCMLRRSGSCTELKSVLCDDYKPVPYVSSSERSQWIDSKSVFYQYEDKHRKRK